MLRAGKMINIKKPKVGISVKDAFIISPVINLFGIMIRSDIALPEAIKIFLAIHGIAAGRVRYKGEMLARIKGTFEISSKAVESFISENSDLVTNHNLGWEEIPESNVLKAEIQQHFDDRDAPIRFLEQISPETINLSEMTQQRCDFFENIGTLVGPFTTHAQTMANNIIIFGGPQYFAPDRKCAGIPLSIMSHTLTLEKMCLSPTSIKIEDALLESKLTIDLQAEEKIEISRDADRDWINNPHPEIDRVKITKRVRHNRG